MFLTVPQKFLKGLLKDFGALKKSQAELFIKMYNRYCTYEQTVLPLLRNGEAKEIGEYLTSPNGKITQENILALDIMLMIENEKVDYIQKGTAPFTVTFFKQKNGKLWRFDICVVKLGYERLVTAALEGINVKYRTVVFVLENPIQQESLIAPCEYCFAWEKLGKYHFYKEKR